MHVTIRTGLYVPHGDDAWAHDRHICVDARDLLAHILTCAETQTEVQIKLGDVPDGVDGEPGLPAVVAELVDCGWLRPAGGRDRYELTHPGRLAPAG